jgi:microcystin-dependent protein
VSYTSTANANTDTPPSANWVADSLGTTFTTGMVVMTLQPTPSSGWVFCNDGTIGNAASGATTRANADTMALFEMIWNGVSNTYAPVSGGRGANAAADFAANKKITLPAMLGRALAVAGTGAGLTARTLGETVGEEAHALTGAENGPHTHTINDPGHAHTIVAIANSGGTSSSQLLAESDGLTTMPTSTATTGITINSEGSGTAHNTMQPTTFLNAMIKL